MSAVLLLGIMVMLVLAGLVYELGRHKMAQSDIDSLWAWLGGFLLGLFALVVLVVDVVIWLLLMTAPSMFGDLHWLPEAIAWTLSVAVIFGGVLFIFGTDTRIRRPSHLHWPLHRVH